MRRLVLFLVVGAAAACSAYHAGTDDAGAGATDAGADATNDVGSTPPPGTPPMNTRPPPGATDAGYGCPAPGDAGSDCDGAVWNGHCYFFASSTLVNASIAESSCAAAGGHLATFTCAAEWKAGKPTYPTNAWIGLQYGSDGWAWTTGEPLTFANVGPYFDGGPPDAALQSCAWSDQNGAWEPVFCTASSANAYCERP